MSNENDFTNQVEIQWCPGCPNFGILRAFKKAFAALDKTPQQLCLVSGIGQAAKLPHYLKCNFFNGLHGRALPAAIGIHAANPLLTTVVVTGEGDCYGEGGNHFLHALRRNPDITLVVHNNEFYALTKGQASPTTPTGERRSLQIEGVEAAPLNMMAIAIAHDCTYVARGFAGDIEQLSSLLVEAVRHPGLAYVEVIQPCITWGTRPLGWYKREVLKRGAEYDPRDRETALKMVLEPAGRMATGLLYRGTPRKTFGARFRQTVRAKPLAAARPIAREKMAAFLDGFKAGG